MKIRSQFSNRLRFESLEPRAMLAADPGWAFALAGPALESTVGMKTGADGSLYVAGAFSGTTDFDPGPGVVQLTGQTGANDMFLAKYTPQGALVWAQKFGGNGNDYVSALEIDSSGNLCFIGHFSSSTLQLGASTLVNQGSYDVFAAKADAASGSVVWAKSAGGTGQDSAWGIAVNADDEVYTIGTFRRAVDFDPSPTGEFILTEAGNTDIGDAFVWKLDANGSLIWTQQFGNEYLDNGHRIAVGGDGFVYAAGTYRGTVDYGQPGNPIILTAPKIAAADVFMIKLDELTGDAVWARQATGPAHINAARLVADGAGSLYFAGGFQETVNFGAGTPTLASAGGTDTFISKWDTSGTFVWAESFAGSGEQIIHTLALDPAGNPLVDFAFDGTTDFDPQAGVANLTSTSQLDGAALKLNADGSLAWVRQMSGPGITSAQGIMQDSAGNVYVGGAFTNTASLTTGHNLARSGSGTFIMKLAFGDPATKFYVVDDGSANRTFEYDATGTTGGNNALSSGNSAPRGAASTAAGDRVWTVDANRNVYVYDINGNQLGSWSAGSMATNATPEGIATNGTDVWIVDSKSDKVFKYTGAATRLSGSQNAASSFNLNSGNTNPKDIVTNGTSLWVVNDAPTDKVFKYSVAGGLQGNWTIDVANSQPTGITIDPANVSDIWIVDNGTDRVYQYVGAASRTAGSQNAVGSFALASGNINPQGIADPPAAGSTAKNALWRDTMTGDSTYGERQQTPKTTARIIDRHLITPQATQRNGFPSRPSLSRSDCDELRESAEFNTDNKATQETRDTVLQIVFAEWDAEV